MTTKIFLLGVGCQKGGTSWLHDYLHSHPKCDFGFRKEYHIFDGLFMSQIDQFYKSRLQNYSNLIDLKQKWPNRNIPSIEKQLFDNKLLLEFYAKPDTYAQYFDQLYNQSKNVKVVGDITPSYCALESEHFDYIKRLLEKYEFTVKVIFLLRDPVDRIFSMLRMDDRNEGPKSFDTGVSVIDEFKEQYKSQQVKLRTEYDKTIINLEKAFDRKNIHYEFYETLFNSTNIEKISNFLHLEFLPPNLDKRINSSPQYRELPEDAAKLARDYYGRTYDFCMDKFGRDFVKGVWKYA